MAGVGIVIEDKDQDDELTASGAKNNGQLRFVHHHHGWRTQARLDQNTICSRQLIPIGQMKNRQSHGYYKY